MMCHLDQVRERGKLTETSTFPQEGYYGEMRNSYVTGTNSTGKQLLQNAYLKRQLPHKKCQIRIRYRDKESPKSSDINIYIYKNGTYKFYVIKKVNQDGSFLCNRLGKRTFNPTETESDNLNWSSVGVFQLSMETEQQAIFKKSEITGKAIIVNNYIMTCPTNVLQE